MAVTWNQGKPKVAPKEKARGPKMKAKAPPKKKTTAPPNTKAAALPKKAAAPPKKATALLKKATAPATMKTAALIEKVKEEPTLMSPNTTASPCPEMKHPKPIGSNLTFEGEDGAYVFSHMVMYENLDVRKVKTLGLVLNQNDWSPRQDDRFAMALSEFSYGHNLDSLNIWIKGETVFTHENFAIAAPDLSTPWPLEPREKYLRIPAKYKSFQKVFSNKMGSSLQEKPPPILVSSKQMIDAILKLKNIPSINIEGPMETGLRQKIMATCKTPQDGNQMNDVLKKLPDAPQPAPGDHIMDPTAQGVHEAYIMDPTAPRMNDVENYPEAIHRVLKFGKEIRDLATDPYSQEEVGKIRDYLNLHPDEDAKKQRVREHMDEIYELCVEESFVRDEPPFTAKCIEAWAAEHEHYECLYPQPTLWEPIPESMNYASQSAQLSKKRKAASMKGGSQSSQPSKIRDAASMEDASRSVQPSKKRKAASIEDSSQSAQPPKKTKALSMDEAQEPPKTRMRGARVKVTYRRGDGPEVLRALCEVKSLEPVKVLVPREILEVLTPPGQPASPGQPSSLGQLSSPNQPSSPGQLSSLGQLTPPPEASEEPEDSNVAEVPEGPKTPAKKRKKKENPKESYIKAQEAFEARTVEQTVLDMRKYDGNAALKGTLGDMVRVSRHILPVCYDRLPDHSPPKKSCYLDAEARDHMLMSDAFLGWKVGAKSQGRVLRTRRR